MANGDELNNRDNEEHMEQGPSTPNGGMSPPYSRMPSDLPPGDIASNAITATPSDAAESSTKEKEEEQQNLMSNSWLLQKAREIYVNSTDYLDANITNQWETNLSHFNSEHSPGSNFKKTNFKRSRVFRPKTRTLVKAAEAAMAVTGFATMDILTITPLNPDNERQIVSAKINKYILDYRLENSIPWFLTVQGAFQDTAVYGICITHNYWSYKEDSEYVEAFDEDDKPMFNENGERQAFKIPVVREDRLACDNIAPENWRFDASCDWRDPAGTSPYLIYMVPMYVGDVIERMQNPDPKTGQAAWHEYDKGAILGTRRKNYDRTRQAREGRDRIDPTDEQHGTDYTTVWAHMNIVKINGDDFLFWTMGTELVLSDPILLTKAYPHLMPGERPFTMGTSTVESHRNYPSGIVEQTAGLQTEINTVANQRLDNVKLVLNKRFYIRRGSQVDLQALTRNVPGGGVMMTDPEKDVVTVNTPDVTSSSYQEQDRLSMETDELVGALSQGSVQGNKNMQMTTEGMGMMQTAAGSVQDYGIRVFIETWMEPTIKQLARMIAMYENDEDIIALAGQNAAEDMIRFGIDSITDDLLREDLLVKIDVGTGMTDPMRRVNQLFIGIEKTVQLPGMAEKINSEAVTNEIFGTLGYRNGSRFYISDEELAKKNEGKTPPPNPELDLKMRELDIREKDNASRDAREREKMAIDERLRMATIDAGRQSAQEQTSTNRQIAELKDETARLTTLVKDKTDRQKTALTEMGKAKQISAQAKEKKQQQPT